VMVRCCTTRATLFEGCSSDSENVFMFAGSRVTDENNWYLLEGSHILHVKPHANKDGLSA